MADDASNVLAGVQKPVDTGGSSSVTAPEGSASVDEKVSFEVDLLSLAAVRQISAEIASRVAEWAVGQTPPPVVVLIDEQMTAAVSHARHLLEGMDALEAQLLAVLPASKLSAGKSKTLESVIGVAGAASAGLSSLAEVLSWLRVNTVWQGRVSEFPGALFPALAGQLLARNVDIRVFEDVLPVDAPGSHRSTLLGRLKALVTLRGKAAALVPTPTSSEDEKPSPAAAVVAATDAWLTEAFAEGEGKMSIERLHYGSRVAALLDALPDKVLLNAKLLKAGGHYRTRFSIFSTLFGRGPLSYSGGAAIAFSLAQPATGLTLLSDVLFHSSGDVRFGLNDDPALLPSNLQNGAQQDGFSPLRKLKPSSPKPQGAVPKGGSAAVPAPAIALTAEQGPAEGGDVTHNKGDDHVEAEPNRTAPPGGAYEMAVQWRVAKALMKMREQIKAGAPNRSTASDGAIGDAEHATRDSDHNPWVNDGTMGVVTAIDITHDPHGGCDAEVLAESIRASLDQRVKYIIWNRRIASSSPQGGTRAWAWRPYGGKNAHDKHIHISVKSDREHYDSVANWDIRLRS